MQDTYGEEIPLDKAASVIASVKGVNHHDTLGSSASASSWSNQVASTTSSVKEHSAFQRPSNNDMANDDDDELEEGELLEEGEISEGSSDDSSDMIADTLIAPPFKPLSRSVSSQYAAVLNQQLDSSARVSSSAPSWMTSFALAPQVPFPNQSIEQGSYLNAPPISMPTPEDKLLEEFDALVEELYSYGVTCDYLMGKGVTKDLVISLYAAKGYRLPERYMDRYLERIQQQREHEESLARQTTVLPSIIQSIPLPPNNIPQRPPSNGYPMPPPAADRPPSPPPVPSAIRHTPSTSLDNSTVMRLGPLIGASGPIASSSHTRRASRDNKTSVDTAIPSTQLTSSVPESAAPESAATRLQALKEELARKEATAREALRARKAALAKQNADRATNFIEGLLASGAVQPSTTTPPVSASTSMPSLSAGETAPPLASTSASSAPASDLEDYEEGEVDQLPSIPSSSAAVPSSSTAQAKPSRPSHTRHFSNTSSLSAPASSSTTTSKPSRQHNRPSALDFEHEPAQSLPRVPRWTEQLLTASRRTQQNNADMLIDLSSSDEDEDSGSDDNDDDDADDADGEDERGKELGRGIGSSSSKCYHELREAVKKSKEQDRALHSGFYQTQFNPYPSYSLNSARLLSENVSSRASPVPAFQPYSASSIPTSAPSSYSTSMHYSSTLSTTTTTATTSTWKRPPPSQPTSRSSTPGLTSTSASTIRSLSAEKQARNTTAAKNELEAKQEEIKKMMEMIKKLESDKKNKKRIDTNTASRVASREVSTLPADKKGKDTIRNDIPVAAPTASATMATLQQELIETGENAAVSARNATIQAAKEQVDKLLDEQDQLIDATLKSGGVSVLTLSNAADGKAVIGELENPLQPPSVDDDGADSLSDQAMSISSGSDDEEMLIITHVDE